MYERCLHLSGLNAGSPGECGGGSHSVRSRLGGHSGSGTRLGPEEAGLGGPGGGTPEQSCGSGVCLGPQVSVVDAVLRNVSVIDGGRPGVLGEGA